MNCGDTIVETVRKMIHPHNKGIAVHRIHSKLGEFSDKEIAETLRLLINKGILLITAYEVDVNIDREDRVITRRVQLGFIFESGLSKPLWFFDNNYEPIRVDQNTASYHQFQEIRVYIIADGLPAGIDKYKHFVKGPIGWM